MALVLTLLRAAHARGTHHFLALDALDKLAAPSADTWQRLFYKHIAFFVDGAKAPDTAFKDFKNHVLHPRDGFWGGAPEQAETGYSELVTALRKQDWPAAAYNAGVLSHYCTDPCMPLHTHQTVAESNIHAALEWTVSKTYARLLDMGAAQTAAPRPIATASPSWLGDLLRAAATQSTTHYETLLAHYDIKRGVVAPEEGLDVVGQRATAQMLIYARDLVAIAIDRAIT
jgi:Zinc dependent phospholipase C